MRICHFKGPGVETRAAGGRPSTDLAPQAALGVVLVVLYERVALAHRPHPALHRLGALGLPAAGGLPRLRQGGGGERVLLGA